MSKKARKGKKRRLTTYDGRLASAVNTDQIWGWIQEAKWQHERWVAYVLCRCEKQAPQDWLLY